MREEVGYGDAPTFENQNYCPGEKLHYSPHGDLGEKLGLRVTNVVFLEIKLKSNAACKTRDFRFFCYILRASNRFHGNVPWVPGPGNVFFIVKLKSEFNFHVSLKS